MIMFRLDQQKAAAGYRIPGVPSSSFLRSALENAKNASRLMQIPFMANFLTTGD